jgi:hypothetical protein
MPTRSRIAVLLVATGALLGSLPSASAQASSTGAAVSAVWGKTADEVQSNSWVDANSYTASPSGDICSQINQALQALSASNFNGSGSKDNGLWFR